MTTFPAAGVAVQAALPVGPGFETVQGLQSSQVGTVAHLVRDGTEALKEFREIPLLTSSTLTRSLVIQLHGDAPQNHGLILAFPILPSPSPCIDERGSDL